MRLLICLGIRFVYDIFFFDSYNVLQGSRELNMYKFQLNHSNNKRIFTELVPDPSKKTEKIGNYVRVGT